ncbi:MAG: class I adenylate-forming enzyme family protein [Pirellulales bacterium]
MPVAGPPLERPIDLANLLEVGLTHKPDEPALVSFESRWTWRELDQASLRLAGHYLGIGLKPGDRVASLLPNRGALLVHYLACIRAGLVATPLNYRYQAPEIDHALEVSGAAAMVAHAERDDDLTNSKLAGRLRLGRIVFGGGDGRRPNLEEFLDADPPATELPKPQSDAPVFIYFTSGSTGKPKGVIHTRETFGWMVASTVAGLELTPTDTFLPGCSASHIGASLMSLAGLAAGARVDIARTYDGTEVLPLLRDTRPTVLCMLPSALFCVVRDHGAAGDDFRSLRLCISGGDKVSGELEREFIELAGFAIDETYGMSEIGLATMNPPSGPNRIGSIGRLAPGFTASIRDNDGREVPAGSEGRMWIKSASNMLGYWNRPDATAETIIDGWLDTGDVVSIDADGYIWFRGRQKQIIIHDGSNICPQEVEESLLEHPAVESAGVIGIHNLVHGENVRAYIAWRPKVQRSTIAELIQFSRARVGYKAPDEIIVLDKMPINATGKVDRVTLKQLAEATQTTGGPKS